MSPSICFTLIFLFCMDSRIAFSRIWRCVRPLVESWWLQHTQTLLSLNRVMGSVKVLCNSWRSSIRLIKVRRCLVHSSVAYISASAVLRAVMVCHLELQWRGPVSYTTKPERDLDLKSSNVKGGALGDGILWSWGPQLASQNASGWCWIGNLRNALSLAGVLLWKPIPRLGVPFR